jgi:hypothetical protein
VARTYRVGSSRRLVNTVIGPLTRVGLAGRHTYILTVRGRKTGRAYSTPVILIEDGEHWLVASTPVRAARSRGGSPSAGARSVAGDDQQGGVAASAAEASRRHPLRAAWRSSPGTPDPPLGKGCFPIDQDRHLT